MRKAQVTMFIIMAMAVFFIVVTFYFIRAGKQKGDINVGTMLIQIAPDKVKPVESFVESCISQVARKGLDYAGKQGGAIWKSKYDCMFPDAGQNGPLTKGMYVGRFAPLPHDGCQCCIRYGILASPEEETNVDYPWFNFPANINITSEGDLRIIFSCNICGEIVLPRLEDPENDNPDDIDIVLKKYIDTNIQEDCLKHLRSFRNRFNISERTEPNSTVTFRDSDVYVLINYTVELYENTTQGTAVLSTHLSKIPLRFKRLYNLSHYIASADVNFVDYDISGKQVPSDPSWAWVNEDFSISVERHGAEGYDIISVIDSKSKDLNGNSFRFSFVRANRRPALYFINNTEFEETASEFYTFTPSELSNYFGYYYLTNPPPFGLGNVKVLDPDEDAYPNSLAVKVSSLGCADKNLLVEDCTITLPPGPAEVKIPFMAEAVDEGSLEDVQGNYSPNSNLYITLDVVS